jgi:vacuolar-type H+-ATPase subunit H
MEEPDITITESTPESSEEPKEEKKGFFKRKYEEYKEKKAYERKEIESAQKERKEKIKDAWKAKVKAKTDAIRNRPEIAAQRREKIRNYVTSGISSIASSAKKQFNKPASSNNYRPNPMSEFTSGSGMKFGNPMGEFMGKPSKNRGFNPMGEFSKMPKFGNPMAEFSRPGKRSNNYNPFGSAPKFNNPMSEFTSKHKKNKNRWY